MQQSVALRVLGLNPGPVVNPTTFVFAYTLLGTTSPPQSFSVTAFNNDPVSMQIVDAAVSPFFLTQGSSCSITPCQISVAYAPTAANTAPADGNNSYSQIYITDLFSGQAATVSLSGIYRPRHPSYDLEP